MRVIDLDNVLVLAFGEALAFIGLILVGLAVSILEHAKSYRREARAFREASAEYKASGERAYADARQILREWERRSGLIVPGLLREDPPEEKPH